MSFIDDPRKSRKLSRWLIRIVAICLVIYLALRYIDVIGDAALSVADLFSPLILGVILAMILNVALRPIERILFARTNNPRLKKMRRPLAVVISVLLVAGIFVFIVCLIVPELINALYVIAEGLVSLGKSLSEWSSSIALSDTAVGRLAESFNFDFGSLQQKFMDWITTAGPKIAAQAADAFGGIGSGIFNFVVGLVFSIYILLDKENLKKQARRLIQVWLPKKSSDVIIHVASVSNVTFRSFVMGQTTEAVILGTLCAIGMLILQIPYAAMIGALIGVTALIPIFGALIGTVIGAVMILSEEPFKAVVFVIFLLILQQIEGNVIYPKVVGAKIGLPGMWVLAAVTVGGSLAGVLGMLLGVPAFSVIYTLLNEATDLKEKQLKEEESDTVSVSKDNMWTRTDTAMRPGAISSGSTGPEEHDKE